MELTMDWLVQVLGEQYQIDKTGDFSGEFPIEFVSLAVDSCRNERTVYLQIGEELQHGQNILNIVTHEVWTDAPGWYLIFPDGGVLDAVNACLRAFQGFHTWRGKCRELALIEHDLASLLETGTKYLRSELLIIDRDYKYDGFSRLKYEKPTGFYPKDGGMDVDEVEDLYTNNPRFDETFQTDGLIYYPQYYVNNGKLYYYNLRYDRLFLGRLLYNIPTEVDGPGLRHLAEGFGALVAKCYEFHYLRKNKGMPRYSVYDIWKLLLENKPVDQEEADRKLAAMGWEPGQRYRVVYLLSNGYFRSEETMKFYAVQLEQTFSACIAARMEDGIYMLHNLDREEDPDFRQHLADFLRENLFVSGISNEFRDFYDSFRYGCQAKDALLLGVRKNPSLWRHEFRDYQADYVLQQCLSRYSARDLCPEGLDILLRHDEQNPEVELAKTLETYYNCKFNAAEAAKQLYIHRTTFFYRLNKIQQLAAIDVDDPQQRLQILLYFALAREEQRRLGSAIPPK